MADDIGILCSTQDSRQETDSSVNGQPSDAGMPWRRSNNAAGQILIIYDNTLTEDSWAVKLEITSSFVSWREF